MATLSFTGKTFDEADRFLGTKTEKKIGNNTVLIRIRNGKEIAVRLHNTDVVVFFQNGTRGLYSGGYYSTTTKERINQFTNGYVNQKNREWFYTDKKGEVQKFFDGIIDD